MCKSLEVEAPEDRARRRGSGGDGHLRGHSWQTVTAGWRGLLYAFLQAGLQRVAQSATGHSGGKENPKPNANLLYFRCQDYQEIKHTCVFLVLWTFRPFVYTTPWAWISIPSPFMQGLITGISQLGVRLLSTEAPRHKWLRK